MEAFAVLAWPVLMGMAAVGAVLLIKILRRRQATRDPRYTEAVPANPMSRAQGERMLRRYLWAVAVALLVLLGLALLLVPA